MIGKSAFLVGALCASFFVGPVATAAADPYSPSVATDCRVSVPAVVEPGERVDIRVSVRANSPTPPSGTVEVSVRKTPGGTVWSRQVQYDGGTERVVGPVLNGDGQYQVVSRFDPDTGAFAGCRGSLGFAVDDTGGDNPGDDDNGDPGDDIGGLLPNTGGPDLLWLLLGLGLVGGGAGTVIYARRRAAATAATA